MIDVHCHLTGEEFDENGGIQAVVARAKQAGVDRLICSGFDLVSSVRAKELAEAFEEIYFCVGFHPSELFKYEQGDLDKLKEEVRELNDYILEKANGHTREAWINFYNDVISSRKILEFN